jgi:hypothetical protein
MGMKSVRTGRIGQVATAMGRFIGVTIRDRKSLPRGLFLFGLHLFDVADERAR